MTVQLHARHAGEGPVVLLLHGLFGSGANLGALSRRLQEDYCVYSIDLPNHGRSQWLPSPDLPAMAQAVLQWMDVQQVEKACLLGHSLGGKVVMELALRAPERVAGLVVVDIAPVAYPPRHDTVFAALRAVSAAACASRDEAAEILGSMLEEEMVVQFLLMSLAREGEAFGWRFDRAGLETSYPELIAAPATGGSYPGPTLFIKGGDSDYLREEHREHILSLFPAATVRVVSDTGHWLHIEKPALFNSVVSRFLSGLQGGSVCT